MKNLAIIMPVYNEQDIIKKVINDWKNVLNKKNFDIIIINDGSKDKTRSILNHIIKNNNHIKVLNKLNGGHGNSVLFGYKYALKKNYRFIFQVDSDDQFSSSDFHKLWKIKEQKYDLILGCRKNRKDPLIRIILSKVILKTLFIIFFQKYILDANSPFRLINKNFLRKFINNCNKSYLAPNILMSLFAEKIIFVDVKHYQRSTGVIKWSVKKIISFGINLIFEIVYFKLNKKN
jgi:glycosyltransferase involved in cell wall biosynthesis